MQLNSIFYLLSVALIAWKRINIIIRDQILLNDNVYSKEILKCIAQNKISIPKYKFK